jgi:hypothetical protein
MPIVSTDGVEPTAEEIRADLEAKTWSSGEVIGVALFVACRMLGWSADDPRVDLLEPLLYQATKHVKAATAVMLDQAGAKRS